MQKQFSSLSRPSHRPWPYLKIRREQKHDINFGPAQGKSSLTLVFGLIYFTHAPLTKRRIIVAVWESIIRETIKTSKSKDQENIDKDSLEDQKEKEPLFEACSMWESIIGETIK